jgi:hypothetical protein
MVTFWGSRLEYEASYSKADPVRIFLQGAFYVGRLLGKNTLTQNATVGSFPHKSRSPKADLPSQMFEEFTFG